ncbi:MAG: GAF domain-containing protein, partial [Rivularia sp. (in: cyanobacteria)]
MLNKTDSTKSGDAPRQEASLISSSSETDNAVQLSSTQMTVGNTGNVSSNGLIARFKRLSLSTKTTILAMTMVTLPVLVIGTGAYLAASQSLQGKVSKLQSAQTKALANGINRFMSQRYEDIQLIANSPTIKNGSAQQQAVLNNYVNTYNDRVYDGIGVFNLNGDAIVQSQGITFSSQGNSTYFQNAIKNRKAFISQPISVSNNKFNIYIAAPVQNSASERITSVVVAQIPAQALDNVVKNYVSSGQQYYLEGADDKIFLSTEEQAIKKSLEDAGLPNYAPSPQQIQIQGFPALNWDVVLAPDASTAFAAQGNLALAIALGTMLTAAAVAFIAAKLAKRATQPILDATQAVAKLGKGQFNTRLNVEADDEIGLLNANINQMASQLQLLVKEQEAEAEREKLKADITLRIRRSLKVEDIHKTAVREIRQALKTDRVVIYEFNPETWDGAVVAESVSAGFPKMKGAYIEDPCFRERQVQMYKNGRVRAIANIYNDAGLKKADCYIKMLEQFAVKANLIAPILIGDNLMGLLIAHNCETPRDWQQQEIELFKQLATQIGFTLEQARLLEEVEKARQLAQTDSEDERHQKEELQMQLIELLSEVEGAAQGDLTVRADVTAGDIGTVADFFNSIVESLRDIVTQVKTSAIEVNQA